MAFLDFTEEEMTSPVADSDPTVLDRVLNKFSTSARPALNRGPLGLSEDAQAMLRDVGVFTQGDDGLLYAPRAITETLARGGAAAGDLAVRTVDALFKGAFGVAGQIAQEFGASKTSANRLERDLSALAIVGAVVAGTPRGRLPKGGVVAETKVTRQAERIADDDFPVAPTFPTARTKAHQREHERRAGEATPPKAPTETGMAGNINLRKQAATSEAKNLEREVAETSDEFLDARRGVQTNAETVQLADSMGMTPAELLKRRKGEAFNAEQALAARNLLVESSEKVVELAKKARGGSDEDIFAFQEALTTHAAIQEQVSGLTAEAGRTLQQFQIIARGTAGRERALKEMIEKSGGRMRIEDFANKVSVLDDPAQVAQFAREATRKGGKLLEAWINALLSGPKTQVVNVLSNTLTSLWTIPEHFLAATFSAVRGAPASERVFFRETTARMFGWLEGAKDGLKLAAKAFRTESSLDPLSKVDTPMQGAIPSKTFRPGKANKTFEVLGTEVAVPFTGEIQIGGKQVRLPGRLLLAGDEFFKSIGRQMEVNSLAMREGLKRGLRGEDLADFIADFKANPPESAAIAAQDFSRYVTFTKPLGEGGQSLLRFANEHPVVRIIVPFIRTPTNIIKFALERTPASLASKRVREAFKEGGVTRDVQLARLTLGSMVGAAVASLAAEGLISGAGPADPRARNLLRATGWQPYSIKVGDEWFAYNRIEPLGIILGVSADLAAVSGELEEGEAEDIAALLTTSIAQNLTSKTWLRGVSELVEVLGDPGRHGERWLQNMSGTFIPTGVAQVAQARDPVLRDAQSVMDNLRRRFPGYSETLPARRNIWGEPIVLSGGIGPDAISPLYRSVQRPDKVTDEMLRLEVLPSMPQRKIAGVELTPEQYAEYVELAGQPAKRILDGIVKQPAWDRLQDYAKETIVRRVLRETRDAARDTMLLKHPDIIKQKVKADLKERGVETEE